MKYYNNPTMEHQQGPRPPSDSGKSWMLGVNVDYLDVLVSSQLLLSESLTGKSKCVNIYVPVLRETTASL